MHLTATQFGQLFKGVQTICIGVREHRECHEHLIGVQAWVVSTQIAYLGVLYGFYHRLRNELQLMIDTCQMLGDIKQKSSTAPKQSTRMGGDDSAILQLYGSRCVPRQLLMLLGCDSGATEVGADACLIEQHSYLGHLGFVACPESQLVRSSIITAKNLILGSLAAHRIIADAEAHHVHSHVRGRLVWTLSVDAFEESREHWEDFYVAIVVHRYLVVGFKMEWVDHIHIVKVGSGSLVGYVYGVLQWQVPHGECLELGIASLHTTLVLVVELT